MGMDFSFTAAEESYRAEIRSWLAAHIPDWWRQRDAASFNQDAQFEDLRAWHRQLYEAGYVSPVWPVEYGGQGRSHVENAILQEELVRMDAPPTVNGLGINLAGAAIIHHGTAAQQQRFLRPLLRADEIWCQGYSEPGAGSDLANVQTRAELRGDHYLVNGQKIWTSGAHRADWNFCLVRTDPSAPKHDGIGFLLIDMRTPGVEVRPLDQINGGRGFSQVFYTDVEVPAQNMVGSPTEGWRVANTVLGYERGAGALSRALRYERVFDEVLALAQKHSRGGAPASRDVRVREELAQLALDIRVLRLLGLRQLTDLAKKGKHGPESSIQKVYYSELEQRLMRFANDLAGPYGQLWRGSPRAVDGGRWAVEEVTSRSHSIYSGTNQIQRNIIAERVLGLPRG
jgi:alkylation response protein AidB-like acyl-CoA dehydrogenase